MSEEAIHPDVLKAEFKKTTEKFHTIACWVGIILNLVWFLSDYFVLPVHWIDFLSVRALVSTVSLIALLLRKKLGWSIYTCVFILVIGISVQNAYMWSVMDLAHMQKHAFAYMALFIGVGMLVLWEVKYSLVLLAATIISNLVFYEINSDLTVDEFVINGGLLTLTVAIFCIFMIRGRYRLTMNELKARMELARSKELIEKEHNIVMEQKKEILHQKDVLQEKNKEITDSINYAKRIQRAFIPTEKEFNSYFNDSFVLFKPKDIVSGDFYWVLDKPDVIYYATADCTGHGVPGGFMTMLGLSFLEEIIQGKHVSDPAEILNQMRDRIVNTLRQTATAGENKDGMDIILCRLDKKTNKMVYAAANNPMYIIRNGELLEQKADKQPCGFFPDPKPFTLREVQLEKGDCVYTFTDGYADQFGGANGKKFKYSQFEKILLTNTNLPFSQQKEILNTAIDGWRGELEQVDDILVIGIKI